MSKHLLRFILWLTKPTMLRGATLATIFWLLVALAWSFERGANALMLLVAVCVLLLIGAILGRRLADRAAGELKAQAVEPARQALAAISDALAVQDPVQRREALLEAVRGAVPRLTPLAGMAWGGLMTFFAMGSLIAVLGVTVAFASFLATYMGVERQDRQIELTKLQSVSAHQQVAQGMRVEIAAVRQQEAKAAELVRIFDASAPDVERIRRACSTVVDDAPLHLLLPFSHRVGDVENISPQDPRHCFAAIAGTSWALHTRLTGEQMFDADLASGFSATCGTAPEAATDFTEQWVAFKAFGVAAIPHGERIVGRRPPHDPATMDEANGPGVPDTAYALGAASGLKMETLLEASQAIPEVLSRLHDYLDRQHIACQERAISRTELLAELDQQYLSMLPQDVQARSAKSKAQRSAAREGAKAAKPSQQD